MKFYETLDESTIQAIVGLTKSKGRLYTDGIQPGPITNRDTGKPATSSDVHNAAREAGLDKKLVSEVENFVSQRNQGNHNIDKAVQNFKSKKAKSKSFQKRFGTSTS